MSRTVPVRWTLAPTPDPAAVRRLARDLRLPEPLCGLLAVRGHDTPEAAKAFLRPRITDVHDPRRLRGAVRAAARLARAVRRRERVVVHGDYDADGIAGSALLATWLRDLGGRADAIVPDRARDGYDLSAMGVQRAAQRGARVLVTVDCGIVAHGPVRAATEAGMDVIVTDHHKPGDVLPEAMAVVNPQRPDCSYPNKDLCGAAVAFKVGQLVAAELGEPRDEAWKRLHLVALATIADQVRLQGENRALAKIGLRAMTRDPGPGLQALMRQAEIVAGADLDSGDVAFRIAPRINAAGRVGDSRDALRLLMTRDRDEAHDLATGLELDNRRRKKLEAEVTDEALEQALASGDPKRQRGIVVAGEGWPAGVIGIAASRLVDRLFRPVVLVSMQGDSGRGSGRSIPGFDLHAALRACAGHLERFGGHTQAAGLDVSRDNLPAFQAAFRDVARRALGPAEPERELRADMRVELRDLTLAFEKYLRYMGPFGQGNPEPVFVARDVRITECREIANRNGGPGHLQYKMAGGGATMRGISFRAADVLGPPANSLHSSGDPAEVAFNVTRNDFRGRVTVEARALGFRSAPSRSPTLRSQGATPSPRGPARRRAAARSPAHA